MLSDQGPSDFATPAGGVTCCRGATGPSVGERLLLIILKMMEDELGPKDEVFLPSQELFQACGGGDGTTGISSTTALASFLKRFRPFAP